MSYEISVNNVTVKCDTLEEMIAAYNALSAFETRLVEAGFYDERQEALDALNAAFGRHPAGKGRADRPEQPRPLTLVPSHRSLLEASDWERSEQLQLGDSDGVAAERYGNHEKPSAPWRPEDDELVRPPMVFTRKDFAIWRWVLGSGEAGISTGDIAAIEKLPMTTAASRMHKLKENFVVEKVPRRALWRVPEALRDAKFLVRD